MSKESRIETHPWLNRQIQELNAEQADKLMNTRAHIKVRTETHRNEVDFKWPFMVLWR